ncbi:Activating transcription factor 7-interacting protein 1 [Lobaria immixta]|nr:Activating transcription factor 7-interacting protein 1 [Lobaria immixta]
MAGDEPEVGDQARALPSHLNQRLSTPLHALALDPLFRSLALTVRVGSLVSWQYGGGQPSGVVAEKKTEGEVAVTSKRGNTIKRKAEPDNPAVHVARSGNDVVKKMSEVEVEDKAHDEPNEQETTANGEEEKNTGDKRPAEDEPAEEEPAKKAKVGRGRPKKVAGAAPKKAPAPKKKPAPAEKKAAAGDAATGEPAADKPTADKPVADKPVADKPATDKPATDKAADPAKKGRGRPRKEEGATTTPKPKAPKKEKKPRAVANGTGVGSRTRSAKK